MINGALSDNRMDLLHYCDQQHMPAPGSLRRFSSEIGLSVHFHNAPRDIRLDYQAPDGTEFHIEFQGLMDPFDTHDPITARRHARSRTCMPTSVSARSIAQAISI